MTAVAQWGTIHLIGIGGAGMSVVAELLAAEGLSVQGSDARSSPGLAELRRAGIRVWVGHDAAHVAGADTVVISSAVRPDNPERVAAEAAGLPVVHRSQALAALMEGRRSIAVAGAHGKTTTSAMIAAVLASAGQDPSYAIGSSVLTSHGSVPGGRRGSGDIIIAEADESDGSFLNYAPLVAVVTNVEADHMDHYGSAEAFERAFGEFVDRIVPGGTLVACLDDPGAAALGMAYRRSGGRVVTYGTAPGADVVVRDAVHTAQGSQAVLDYGDLHLAIRLNAPGDHNLLNAAAAFAAAVVVGVEAPAAARGLAEFRGTGRRFETRGVVGGIRVVDDYAHHPTEVAALLSAARAVATGGRLIVVFQPHLYSRTRAFAAEFAEALDYADCALVTDVYAAREDIDPQVGPALIVRHMSRGRVVADRFEAAHQAAAAARAGDLVLTVGAGDITQVGDVILEDLRARNGT